MKLLQRKCCKKFIKENPNNITTNTLNLSNCVCGKIYFIKKIDNFLNIKQRRRLLELGFINGEKIVVIRKSLLGQTFLVKIKNYTLSLRQEIAFHILIKENSL